MIHTAHLGWTAIRRHVPHAGWGRDHVADPTFAGPDVQDHSSRRSPVNSCSAQTRLNGSPHRYPSPRSLDHCLQLPGYTTFHGMPEPNTTLPGGFDGPSLRPRRCPRVRPPPDNGTSSIDVNREPSNIAMFWSEISANAPHIRRSAAVELPDPTDRCRDRTANSSVNLALVGRSVLTKIY